MPVYHPRSTRTQRPLEDRTVLLSTAPHPLRRLRRIGDTRPLPRPVADADRGLGGTRPTLVVPRRTRNGREESEKLRWSVRARARAAFLLGADFLNPILVGCLGLCCLAAAGILWAGSTLDLSGGGTSPAVPPSASHWNPSTSHVVTSTTGQPVTPSSIAADVPTPSVRQNVAPVVVDTSQTASALPTTAGLGFPQASSTPEPQSSYSSPPPGDPVTPLTPATPETPASADAASPADGSPSDGSSAGQSGTSSVSVGISLEIVDPSPTS